MHSTTLIAALVALATTASAHMEMSFPSPLRGKTNPLVLKNAPGSVDYNMVAPLLPDGSDYPCKGYQKDLGTPAGGSVVAWPQGADANFTVVGGASHNGGSCQLALSYDKGKTFNVIHSYQGACPLGTGTFKFNIPSDAAAGDALLAWVWWNHTGNREIYMNCASITIAKGTGPAPAVAFSARPAIFKANLGNGCTTVEGKDTFFPHPGPDVTNVGTKQDGQLVGNCGSAVDSPAAPASGGAADAKPNAPSASASTPSASSASAASPPLASSAFASSPAAVASPTSSSAPLASGPQTSTVLVIPVGSTPTSTAAGVAAPSGAVPSGSTGGSPSSSTGAPSGAMIISTSGECGGITTCSGSTFGKCCSTWGYCGVTPQHCGEGCQAEFGECGGNATGSVIRGRMARL